MRNSEVARLLYDISELLELSGENIFKIRAYSRAAKEHKLRRISHFGAVKEENLLKSIQRYRHRNTRIPLGTALPLVKEIVDLLKKSRSIERIELAGSLRRRKETVGDIDILAPHSILRLQLGLL